MSKPGAIITIVLDADGANSYSFLQGISELAAAEVLFGIAEDFRNMAGTDEPSQEALALRPGLAGRRVTNAGRTKTHAEH